MNKKNRSVIIISATSDIGIEMCKKWRTNGWDIYGTYRTSSQNVKNMEDIGVKMVHCDLSNNESINSACSKLRDLCSSWDTLIIAVGDQEPVGSFLKSDFTEWEKGVHVNFLKQMQVVHELLPFRNTDAPNGPCVLLFAGAGTSNAPVNYSAYIVSKIALIKMCELLDAEIPDTRFSIIGPGWVKTKIHNATLKVGEERAGLNYLRTLEKLEGNECSPMNSILDCFEWIIDSPREIVSGRNFSVVFDAWGTEKLTKRLSEDRDMYKLRRLGNDWK